MRLRLTPRNAAPAFWERIWRTIGYASVGLTGVAMVVAVPSAIGFELGWWVIIWAGFLLAGIPAAVFAWRGRYRGEFVTLPFLAGALVIYDIFLWIQTFYEPLNMAAAFLVLGFGMKLAARIAYLHMLVKVREAQ